ncbi:hypothetical protein ACFWOL_15280 [Streptomyces sp. NPDC058442]|uniref:hypothetical protein n=1 Tax=Streptomyces sp. NPDC058442 TaxID=3346503 RepID=UPI0036563439
MALGKADPELAGVRVADGPEVTGDSNPDWLIVGFDGDPSGDFEAAESASEYSGLSTRLEEQWQITVAAIANRGDTEIVAARKRAYEIGGCVVAWLRASPNLGLRELEAGVGAMRLVQDQTEQGASARLLITVSGRGFI